MFNARAKFNMRRNNMSESYLEERMQFRCISFTFCVTNLIKQTHSHSLKLESRLMSRSVFVGIIGKNWIKNNVFKQIFYQIAPSMTLDLDKSEFCLL